jgi:hypothetical protein
MDTTHLPPDFKEFLRLLNENRVEYLLVGANKKASGRLKDLVGEPAGVVSHFARTKV